MKLTKLIKNRKLIKLTKLIKFTKFSNYIENDNYWKLFFKEIRNLDFWHNIQFCEHSIQNE